MTTWIKHLEERGQQLKDRYVSKVEKEHWTKREVDMFQTDWKVTQAKDCTVRIVHPFCPHGSRGTANGRRVTFLPWFCALQKDLSTLEIPEGRTWEELSAVHRDLVARPRTPLGHSVNYGRIPFKFPVAVKLHLSNPISQALMHKALG